MRLYEAIIYLEEALEGFKAKRAEFIKQKVADRDREIPGFSSVDDFLEAVANADPTIKGLYMTWIVTRILKDPGVNRTEDLARVRDDLVLFEKHKSEIQQKDINAYKTFHDLYDAVSPFTKKRKPTAKEKQEKRLGKIRGDIETVYDSQEGWIRIPKTKSAACYLGQNTRWCTAGRRSNMFDQYNKDDPLFVIYDKDAQKRYQLHIFTGQFNDVADKPVKLGNVPQWARQPLLDWYKNNVSDVKFRQVMTLSKLTSPDMVRNMVSAPQADLLSLMDEYGI